MTDAPSPDAIDVARFAEIMAHLGQFPEARAAEVLARLGVAPAAWQAASARWWAARDAELAAGATAVTRRFGVAFARTRKRLEAEQPALESLGRLAEEAPAPPPDPAPPARAAAPAHLFAGTVAASGYLPVARLPFGSAAPAQAFAAAIAHAAAAQGPAPFALHGETVGLPAGVADGPRVPAGVPDLTLPQYASLRVDLHESPGQAEAILARYGVPPGGRPPLDAHWRARFEADPLLRMMFAKAYATYLAWLRARAGGA